MQRNNQRCTEPLQGNVHGIAWLMCQRLGDDFDNDSLFSVTWCDVLEQNYFDGHQLKWMATMINSHSNITRPATL